MLDQTFLKQKNATYAKHLLLTREQKPGESIAEYSRELKSLAKDCDWRAVSAQELQSELTRDAFITGITSSFIKQRLLEEDALTLDDAISKAEILEKAQNQSRSLFAKLLQSPVSAACSSQSETRQNKKRCHFCAGNMHPGGRKECPAKDCHCWGFGKRGHFYKACRSSSKSLTAGIHDEKDDQISSGDDNVAASLSPCLLSLTGVPSCLALSTIPVQINKKIIYALLDSGASHSHISLNAVEWLKLKVPNGPITEVALAKQNATFKTLVKTSAELTVVEQKYNLQLGVTQNLGQDFMKRHRRVVFEVKEEGKDIIINSSVCTVAAAKINPIRIFKNLDSGTRPIATKSRHFNAEDQQFIRLEIKKLLDDNIIEPSTSLWQAQVLIADDGRHKKRMVIDYSRTINKFTLLDAYLLPRIDDQVNQIARGRTFSTLDVKSAYHQIPLCEIDREYTAFEADGKLYQYTRLSFGVTNVVSLFQRIIQEIIQKYKLQGTYAYLDNITVVGANKEDHDRNLNALLKAAAKNNMTFNESKSIIAKSEIDLLGYRVSHGVIRPDPERLKPLMNLQLPTCKLALQRLVGMLAYYARWIPQFSKRIRSFNLAITSNDFPLS